MVDLILSEKDAARFFRFLVREPSTGCLLWIGRRDPDGYGEFKLRGKCVKAHRVAFIHGGGVTSESQPHVLHGCPLGHNPACCEFTHLRAGNDADNARDRVQSGRGSVSAMGLPFGVKVSRTRFQAAVKIDGRMSYLGTYDSIEEAHAAALAARVARDRRAGNQADRPTCRGGSNG